MTSTFPIQSSTSRENYEVELGESRPRFWDETPIIVMPTKLKQVQRNFNFRIFFLE